MIFLAGYILGIATAGFYLIGEALYEASRIKRRRASFHVVKGGDDESAAS